jgi:hypothetical protein
LNEATAKLSVVDGNGLGLDLMLEAEASFAMSALAFGQGHGWVTSATSARILSSGRSREYRSSFVPSSH